MAHLQTEETRQKIRERLTGKKVPLDVRLKQSETRKRLFREGKLTVHNKGQRGTKSKTSGAANPAYKERIIGKRGYVYVHAPGHPNASKDTRGLILEHRLVMSQILGRPLWDWEQVHHRNAVKGDNRPDNLLLVIQGGHNGKVKCPFCHKEFGVK
jgi:hypothetical protein